MRQLRPSEISGRILGLMEESDERVILVSPYVKISKWYKLLNRLDALRDRGIPMEIVVRDDPRNTRTYLELDELGLSFVKVPHLHCKLYLNEHTGIQTSMNLLLSSETNSIEIGAETETRAEYDWLLAYYYRYVNPRQAMEPVEPSARYLDELRELLKAIVPDPGLLVKHNVLQINAGLNHYEVTVGEGRLRTLAKLRMSYGVRRKNIPSSEFITKKVKDLTAMRIVVHPGRTPGYITISGQAHRKLNSPSIAEIRGDEYVYVRKSILKFITAAEGLEG